MDLTQEYFDEQIKKLASKKDLGQQTKELKAFAEEQTEHLARMVADTVVLPLQEQIRDVSKKLDKKLQNTDKLEKDMLQIKTALHLS